MRTGIASFPLDYGTCPKWLFERMTKLSRTVVQAIVSEFSAEEFLKRLSDPVWFQSFGSVLAFDWNSSGLTTTVTGAIKAGLYGLEKDLGIFTCGGKGKTSRKTPNQIIDWADKLCFSQEQSDKLVYSSKISAKVDNTAIQDGFQLYHHTFIFTKSSNWVVVQQGMNEKFGQARRYHWLSDNIKDFVEEPHTGISSDLKVKPLNLTAKQSKKTKQVSTELVRDGYNTLMKDLQFIKQRQTGQYNLFRKLDMPDDSILPKLTGDLDFAKSKYLNKILYHVHERAPENFEQVLMTQGVGPMTIRALSLVSELIYGAKPSYEDPARYSFAFGGKDEVPFPVNRPIYDKTLDIIEKSIKKSQIGLREKREALRRFTKSFQRLRR
jgi:hypothetical protein